LQLRGNVIYPGVSRTLMRPSGFPTHDPLRLQPPAENMPVYLWLRGDDIRRKAGRSFDAQPVREPVIVQ
ncbi:YciK family oxidoreductase, partial [Klebsiella pneumoniae]|nr:YciK family oxidoreductase [Klebsiella pneumoniae]